MNNKLSNPNSNLSALLKKLGNLLIDILGVIISIFVALFALLKNTDWKGVSATAKKKVDGFDKEKAVHFLKTNKKAVMIGGIVVGVLLILSDSLFYTPPKESYEPQHRESSRNSGYTRFYQDTSCFNCHGSGNCPHCNGSGIYRNYGQEVECVPCDGLGICATCDGSGKN